MNIKRPKSLIMILLALLLISGLLLASSEMISRSLVGSGGGQITADGLSFSSAIGQLAVGTVDNGLTLCSGFLCWEGALAGGTLFLPFSTK